MEISEDWGEVVEPAEAVGPIVFQFRPTRYVKEAPERLKEWEAFFVENTGLAPDAESASRYRRAGSASISFLDGPLDCDYVA